MPTDKDKMNNTRRRRVANVLIGAGLVLLLLVIGYFGWTQVSAQRLRAELKASPAATLVEPTAPATAAVAATTAESTARVQVIAAAPTVAVPTVAAPTATPTRTPTVAPTKTETTLPTKQAAPTRTQPTATAKPISTASQPGPTAAPAVATAAPAAPADNLVRLAIPDLKIDAKVVPMTWQVVNTAQGPRSEWVIPKNDAGHHINSARLGEAGNLVISGHNNIFGRVFLNISQAWDNTTRIKVDDFTDRSEILTGRILTLYDTTGQGREYQITDFFRVRDSGVSGEQRIANGRFMLPTEQEQVTIITCWPPTNNTHRLVVIARPVQ